MQFNSVTLAFFSTLLTLIRLMKYIASFIRKMTITNVHDIAHNFRKPLCSSLLFLPQITSLVAYNHNNYYFTVLGTRCGKGYDPFYSLCGRIHFFAQQGIGRIQFHEIAGRTSLMGCWLSPREHPHHLQSSSWSLHAAPFISEPARGQQILLMPPSL